jgi:hypothetical protein
MTTLVTISTPVGRYRQLFSTPTEAWAFCANTRYPSRSAILMSPAARGTWEAVRRRIVGGYLGERARRRYERDMV